MVGCYEHGNEPKGFVKGWALIDQLGCYLLLRKNSVPRN